MAGRAGEQPQPHRAELWENEDGDAVRCRLCAFRCHIAPGRLGVCQVRKNIDGVLYSLNYHAVTAWHVDPIEKKPLFHFLPGTRTFSLACAGCNFRCSFCQNWQISQAPREYQVVEGQSIAPGEMVRAAVESRCRSMAYTYTEPTIFMEYARDCAAEASRLGLKNVFVSNGYLTGEAIEFIRPHLHAINVDLKSFSDAYYRQECKARLEPVLEALRYLAHRTDIWIEITTLLVPGGNDSDEELGRIARFIAEELRPSVPWHISRFHPDFKMTDRPGTPVATIERAMRIGKQAGLHYVYAGNVWGNRGESTFCHACQAVLIERRGHAVAADRLADGRCPQCGQAMAGVLG